MKQSDIFRENAENCLQLAERAKGVPSFRRYSRMARAWTALAHEQDWLDGEVPPCAAHEADGDRSAADVDHADDRFSYDRIRGDDPAGRNKEIVGRATDDEI
jgi:hypothetical protein